MSKLSEYQCGDYRKHIEKDRNKQDVYLTSRFTSFSVLGLGVGRESVLGVKPKVLYILDKCSTTKLYFWLSVL